MVCQLVVSAELAARNKKAELKEARPLLLLLPSHCQWSTDEQHRSRSGAFRAIFISALFQLAVLKDACLIFTRRLWTAGQLQISYEVTAETPVHTGV